MALVAIAHARGIGLLFPVRAIIAVADWATFPAVMISPYPMDRLPFMLTFSITKLMRLFQLICPSAYRGIALCAKNINSFTVVFSRPNALTFLATKRHLRSFDLAIAPYHRFITARATNGIQSLMPLACTYPTAKATAVFFDQALLSLKLLTTNFARQRQFWAKSPLTSKITKLCSSWARQAWGLVKSVTASTASNLWHRSALSGVLVACLELTIHQKGLCVVYHIPAQRQAPDSSNYSTYVAYDQASNALGGDIWRQ